MFHFLTAIKMEKVTNITDWVRSIKPEEVKIAALPYNKSNSLNILTSRYNCGRGRERGLFVHYHYNPDLEVAVIVCQSRMDYLNDKRNGNNYKWREQIPKNYR